MASRAKTFVRLATETVGTLGLCTGAYGTDLFIPADVRDRLDASVEELERQRDSMNVEYGRAVQRIESEMKAYLDLRLGDKQRSQTSVAVARRAFLWGNSPSPSPVGESSAATPSATSSPARSRDWMELIDNLLSIDEADQRNRQLLLERYRELDPALFQEKYRTLSIPELAALSNFSRVDGPLAMTPLRNFTLSPVRNPAEESAARESSIVAGNAGSDESGIGEEEEEALRASLTAASPEIVEAPSHNTARSSTAEAVDDSSMLILMDTIAAYSTKMRILGEKMQEHFALLDLEIDKRWQMLTPKESSEILAQQSFAAYLTVWLWLRATAQIFGKGTTATTAIAAGAATAKSTAGLFRLASKWALPMWLIANAWAVAIAMPCQCFIDDTLVSKTLTKYLVSDGEDWVDEVIESASSATNGSSSAGKQSQEQQSAVVDGKMIVTVDRDTLDELFEMESLLDFLSHDAPRLQIWKGATELQPFEIQRLMNYDVNLPISEFFIFVGALGRALLRYLSPVSSVLAVSCTYALYRDNVVDPHRAFMHLPPVESFVHSLAHITIAQVLTMIPLGWPFALYDWLSAHWRVTLAEMSVTYPQQPMHLLGAFLSSRFGLITALEDMKHFQRLMQQRFPSQSSSTPSPMRSMDSAALVPNLSDILLDLFRPRPDALDPIRLLTFVDESNGRLRSEWQSVLQTATDVFSGDIFSEAHQRRLTVEDANDFLVALDNAVKAQYVNDAMSMHRSSTPHGLMTLMQQQKQQKQRQALEARIQDQWQPFGCLHNSLNALLFLTNCVTDKDERPNIAQFMKQSFVSSVLTSQARQSAIADLRQSRNADASIDESTKYLFQVHNSQRLNLLHTLYPKGLNSQDFRELFTAALMKYERWGAHALANSLTSAPLTLNASFLQQQLSQWRDATLDNYLDLVQSRCEAILAAQTNIVPLLEPPLYSSFQQFLAGRRPTLSEAALYAQRFHWTLKRAGDLASMDCYAKHGLTPHFVERLERKFATSGPQNEVKKLRAEWSSFLSGPKGAKRVFDAVPMDHNARAKMAFYDAILLKHRDKFLGMKLIAPDANKSSRTEPPKSTGK